MPPSRKTSGSHAGSVRQSKLSFAHRVTKPAAKAAGKDLGATTTHSPLSKQTFPEKTHAAARPKEDADAAELVPLEHEDEEDEEEEEEELQYTTAPVPAPVKTDAEVRAEKVTDAQVGRYWRALEAERLAPRVHQEDLNVSEKVLRYFDVSSQYGPCIGITRMKRWMRAERLGLKPPIEVLAVLLKEEKAGNSRIERAHMDEIMNSTSIGAGVD